MLQSHRKNKNELIQKNNSEEKTHQFVEISPKRGGNPTNQGQKKYNRRIVKTRKRDFVSQIYKDTGFVCEV